MNKSLIVLKPNILSSNLLFPALLELSMCFKILDMRTIRLTKQQALEFYDNAHQDRLNSGMDINVAEEINQRNSDFISSGDMVSIEVSDLMHNQNYDDFSKTVRAITTDNLRHLYSSHHDVYTKACNGVHASDSLLAYQRDLAYIHLYENDNQLSYSKLYEKCDEPSRVVNDELNYNLRLMNSYVKLINNLKPEIGCSVNPHVNYDIFCRLSSLTPYLVMYAKNPTVSNAVIVNNCVNFLLYGINETEYKIINTDLRDKLNKFTTKVINFLAVNPEIHNCLKLIKSKTFNTIDNALNKRDLFNWV